MGGFGPKQIKEIQDTHTARCDEMIIFPYFLLNL